RRLRIHLDLLLDLFPGRVEAAAGGRVGDQVDAEHVADLRNRPVGPGVVRRALADSEEAGQADVGGRPAGRAVGHDLGGQVVRPGVGRVEGQLGPDRVALQARAGVDAGDVAQGAAGQGAGVVDAARRALEEARRDRGLEHLARVETVVLAQAGAD